MEQAVVKVGGMTCSGCVRSVTNVLQALPGVETAQVSLEQGAATVSFDPQQTNLATLKQAIEEAGFAAP